VDAKNFGGASAAKLVVATLSLRLNIKAEMPDPFHGIGKPEVKKWLHQKLQ
jgi:hypothetical protein